MVESFSEIFEFEDYRLYIKKTKTVNFRNGLTIVYDVEQDDKMETICTHDSINRLQIILFSMICDLVLTGELSKLVVVWRNSWMFEGISWGIYARLFKRSSIRDFFTSSDKFDKNFGKMSRFELLWVFCQSFFNVF